MKNIAIIKEGLVNQIVVGTLDFVSTITGSGDIIKDVTDIECGINWEYNSDSNEFTKPNSLALSKTYKNSGLTLEEYTEKELKWRDLELIATDNIVPVSDHSDHSSWLEFRQALRDYPQKEGFPDEALRPVPSHFTEEQSSLTNPSDLLSSLQLSPPVEHTESIGEPIYTFVTGSDEVV